jgi:hypothetical protein
MMENSQESRNPAVGENGKGQSYNYSDQELIRQLVKSRMAQKSELEYEDLAGYELPPRSQFSMLNKPAVSIKYGKMTFNMACIRLFHEVRYILPMVHREKKRLTVVICSEEESESVEWARIRKTDDAWVNKTISSEEFILKIFRLMGWKLNCRYKVLGRVANSERGLVLVFDLSEAIMFDAKPKEFVDEETGEIKKKQIKYYPDEYKDRIGKSYNDYIQSKQMNIFEFLEGYVGQGYSDMPETETSKPKETAETVIVLNDEQRLLPELHQAGDGGGGYE